MKHLILFACLVLAFTACKKKYCWQCTSYRTTTYSDPATGKSSAVSDTNKTTLCEMTSKDAVAHQTERTYDRTTDVSGSPGATQRDVMQTSCTKE